MARGTYQPPVTRKKAKNTKDKLIIYPPKGPQSAWQVAALFYSTLFDKTFLSFTHLITR